jgi:antirestriction protein ArdC
MKREKTSINDMFKQIVDDMIPMIEKEGLSWLKGWHSPKNRPLGLASGTYYSGMNLFITLYAAKKRGYSSPYWVTFNHARKMGGAIKKGEKGTKIFYFNFLEKEKTVINTNGQEERKSYTIPMMKAHTVFNLDQTNLKLNHDAPEINFQPIDRAEEIIRKSGADIVHGEYDPHYSPSQDQVRMPQKKHFKSESDYYENIFHEIGHWTGHESRLNRDKNGRFGDYKYAVEELVAELTSVFTLSYLGIDYNGENCAAYLKSWLKGCKGNPQMLYKTANEATKAVELLIPELKENPADIPQEANVSSVA